MGKSEVDLALELARSHGLSVRIAGGAPIETIERAERLLQFRFPATYRAFLATTGKCVVGGEEVFGVFPGAPNYSLAPDVVGITLYARSAWDLPKSMLVIYFEGSSDWYTMDCVEADPPVVVWQPGLSRAGVAHEVIAPNFATFVRQLVDEQVAET